MANTRDTLGEAETYKRLVERTITEYIDDTLTSNIKKRAFEGCTVLTHVELPNITRLDKGYEFFRCTALEEISLPKVTSIEAVIGGSYNSRAFQRCSSLRTIKLPKVTNINQTAFYNCDAIEVMYIGTETTRVAYFTAQESLPATLQAIYVPDDLVNSYKADTYWSRVATFIFPVSQSPDA